MGNPHLSTTLLTVLFIAGCSPAKAPEPPPPPAKTVFDPMTQNLEKARDVQKAVDANTDATRQSVDHEERGDNPQ
jgi:hypothetical protein